MASSEIAHGTHSLVERLARRSGEGISLRDIALAESYRPCPHCRLINAAGSSECRGCGVIFAKWRARREREETVSPAARPRYLLPCAFALAGWACFGLSWGFFRNSPPAQPAPVAAPERGAAADIAAARTRAKASGRLVLIEVGGDWCPWSRLLDRTIEGDPELRSLRDGAFVTVKVYAGPLNWNRDLLAPFGPIPGYPHFLVLGCDGGLLESKDTEELEGGGSYDRGRLAAFFSGWSGRT